MDQPNTKPLPRVPLCLRVEYRKSYSRQNLNGELQNISLSGAFLGMRSTIDFETNDKILITFKVSGRIRNIPAKLIWKNENGCGVQFLHFNSRDLQIVDDLIYFIENKRRSRREVLDGIFDEVA